MSQKTFNQTLTGVLEKQANKGKIHATIGAPDGGVEYYNTANELVPDFVWVTFSDETTVRVVRNKRVLNQFGVHVILKYASDGILEVAEEDTILSSPFSGGRNFNIPNHAWAHGLFGPDALYVDGLQLKPLQPHPTIPASLNIIVESYYYKWAGIEKHFSGDTLDLTGYHTAIGGGSHTFVIIALNGNTNAAQIIKGFGTTPFISTIYGIPFTLSDIAQVDTFDLIPICAVRLYSGQIEITWLDIFADLRNSAGLAATPIAQVLSSVLLHEGELVSFNDELVWSE